MHLSADYWIDKTGGSDDVLKKQEEIKAFNRFAFANDPNMVDLTAYPALQTGNEISKLIQSISKPHEQDLFYRDGGKIERTDMRTWPTEDIVFKSRETFDLDRFQENGLFPAAAVAILHESEDGELNFRTALIARSQDVHLGYLPYTRRSIIQQAFKFLGERYGWGHSYNARDCTGLVSEVYRTVGILLPRNSIQQGSSPIGDNIRFSPDDTAEEKLQALASADVGNLLYSTGHVMLYLGTMDGQPYVIHDLSGSGGVDEDGKYEEGALDGVSVTPLSPEHVSQEFTYLEKMYAIKKIA